MAAYQASSSALSITGISQSQSSSYLAPLTVNDALTTDGEELKWLNSLRYFLYNKILLMIEPDNETRKAYVSATAMRIWMAAFTHSSYNPNYGENYEVLEKVGDAAMKLAFTWYLMRKFPSITEAGLSTFNNVYLAKPFQAKLAVELGLSSYIRTRVDISKHTKEDALESLFGGLFTISEALVSKCKLVSGRDITPSYSDCYQLLTGIFADVKINLNYLWGSVQNQIKEIFDKMRWKSTTKVLSELETEYQLQDKQWVFELRFNDPFYQWVDAQNLMLKRQGRQPMGFTRDNNSFGTGVSYNKKEAKDQAYENGLEKLASYGITWEWADKMKAAAPSWNMEVQQLYQKATELAKQQGMTSVEFGKIRKGSAAYYLQLYGVDTNGRKYVLSTVDGTAELPSMTKGRSNITDDDMRKAVLVAYLKRGYSPDTITYKQALSNI